MTGERHAIDEYVRRAARVSDQAAASQVDPRAKQELLDRILGEPGPAPSAGPAASRSRRLRLSRLALAGAAAGVLVLAGGVAGLVALAGDGGTPATTDRPAAADSAAGGSDEAQPEEGSDGAEDSSGPSELGRAMMDCAATYTPESLAERAFAFDGTVVEVGAPPAADEQDALYVDVTFEVAEWFHGGDADRFAVSMFPPEVVSSIDNETYQVGSRLLVTGEDRWERERIEEPVAWYCGFTRTYSPAMADEWRQAFAG
jgi:hypothetical protein